MFQHFRISVLSVMQHILVNALSVTNQSGAHVLLGHLDGLIDSLVGSCRFTILCRPGMTAFRERLKDRVDWLYAPERTTHWMCRTVWERQNLGRIAHRVKARLYFTPSGIAASSLNIPQVVFCQNPWALTPAARRPLDAPKAWLQRLVYRQTMRRAEVMVFNSRFMQKIYRRNAGFSEKHGVIVYQAPDDATCDRARSAAGTDRIPGQILCVSAMDSHKNVETVIRSLYCLRSYGHPEATLIVAGSWPDKIYEQKIRKLTRQLELYDHIRFTGFVSREELDRLYAESQVFCLMSKCESFGIPSVEAQLFGTPVVSSNVCAIPEICGDGGMYRDPDDVTGVTDALDGLLANPDVWQHYSQQARKNSKRFAWKNVTCPLQEMFAKMLDES